MWIDFKLKRLVPVSVTWGRSLNFFELKDWDEYLEKSLQKLDSSTANT
jgi:hypothetical protein